MKRLIRMLAAGITLFTAALSYAETTQPLSNVLTSFDFNVVGLGLNASPDYQAVPKGIASKVDTVFDAGSFNAADIIAQLPADYTVRAELSGPGFQTPVSLITKPGRGFDLPSLAILGKYTLSNIRLVDGKGVTLFGAVPQAVAIESISDPLVTSVTTRPLTLEEIKERGVTFDSSNFTAYQFTAGIATQSGQVPLNLPVIIPTSAVVNNPPEQVAGAPVIDLPPVPEMPQVALPQNMTVAPFLMQVEEREAVSQYQIPPIPGIVVIPGNIGFLHQYFSALALVTNGAPLQSGLVIKDVQTRIILPLGANLTRDTGSITDDDPLRMAKKDGVSFAEAMGVMNAGPDGKSGTSDDVSLLHPAESGQADFTIEGMKEGTHKLDFEITATLEGLPIGPVTLKGRASGAVLVRNPDFSITLGHPSTIRSGEEYDLFVTVTNTSKVPANLVTVSLDPLALSGAVFVTGEEAQKSIETIAPGSAASVKYRLKSQRTGKVTATAFESPEIKGKFILRTGVGELNIPLSPDSLILPYTADLPADLLTAAMSLLGQAWSVATAPTGALPSDVLPITKAIVSARAFDLSEAGLRIALGDTQLKAVEDLAFDVIGSDSADPGFDNLRRRSSQGVELNRALAAIFKKEADASGLLPFQQGYSDKVSYRPSHISVVTSAAPVRVRLTDPAGNGAGGLNAQETRREIPYGDQLLLLDDAAERSTLTLATSLASGDYKLELAAEAEANLDLGVVVPDGEGHLQQLSFSGVHLVSGARALLTLHPGVAGSYLLTVDDNGDGSAESSISPTSVATIADHGPQIVAVTQIVPGVGPGGDKHGRNVAVLFSERVAKETAQNRANYLVDANKVSQVNLQPGSRMAFLLLRDGIGPFFDRNSTISGLTDNAGNQMDSDTRKITATAKGPAAVVTGAVRTANGEPVSNATIRLYQLVWHDDGITIEPRYALFSEKGAGTDGTFQFDYVLQNGDPAGPFMLEAVNPATKEVGSLTTGVTFNGQQLPLDIFMRARGSVSGTVRNPSGSTVAGATVLVTTLNDNRSYSATSDGTGAFSVSGIGVGAFSLKSVHQPTLSEGRIMGTLPDNGGSVVQDVVLYRVADVEKGNIAGKVVAPDGVTPRSGVIVIVEAPNYRNWMRTGTDGAFVFNGVFAGAATITARDDASGETSVVSGVVSDGATSVLNVIMKGTGTVTGLVERGDGKSVAGLYVICKVNQIARVMQTDANGAFTFGGLTTGQVSIEVLDPKDFNRSVASGAVTLFSAGETADIYLYVPEKAFSSGTIQGTVYNRAGAPLANAELRQLVGDLSFYVHNKTDAEGKYSIPNLPLGTYRLVAISGKEVANATATLWYDTQVKSVNMFAAGIGTVTGTIYNESDMTGPTGADVTLVSTKPNEVGWLVYEGRSPSVVKSDPQSGRYSFTGVYAGSLTVSSSTVFRPTTVSAGGSIGSNNQTVTLDLALKGTPPQPGAPPVNQMGSISGKVLKPDGTAAGAGISVTVNYGGGISVTTDLSGRFQFPSLIPAGNQRLTAIDPLTTLTWEGYVSVPAGLDVPVTIKLLGEGSLAVRALNADGSAAAGTQIKVTGSSFPNETASGVTDSSGSITFENLPEGSYAVSASGSFGRGGRAQASIPAAGTAVNVDVRLDPSGTVAGKFLKADGVTLIAGGQIRLMHGGQIIAYATSSSEPATLGQYLMEHVPLGDFALDGFDPVTERRGLGGGRLGTDGQTASADIIVTPQGTVKGSVLNHAGTAPIAGSAINISVSGVASFNYSTISAADGSFVFAGVPAGRFILDALDSSNGLRGQAAGNITYEKETVLSEVRIAATGSIQGKLFMPDGLTSANSGTVSISGGGATQIDAGTGAFGFENLAAGRSYTLSASETNTLRKGSAIATITSDGQVAVTDITLHGIGQVQGTVYDSDGTAPLTGAVVRISAAGVSYTDYTENGGYHFSNVPTGSFTLQVSHPNRVTAASASGSVKSEAEVVTVDLTIGPVATVTGKVLLADGVTPARAGGVSFTGNGRNFTAVSDTDGVFVFANIPVPCSFSLKIEDAQGLGIGSYSGSLETNGETKDIGSIVLDDKSISVTGVDPSAGSVNVAINRAVKVVFSEPADPATVNSSTVYLAKGGTRVAGALTLDPDNQGVTFTPAAPLAGFSLYTVVVETGVKDRVGRPLQQAFNANFSTVDNVAPALLSISPANGTLQVAADSVIRVTFSETIDPVTASGIKLLQGGLEVPTRVDLVQGGTVAVLTPMAPLAANADYAVAISGILDSVGNPMPGAAQGSFSTVDTLIPTITALSVPASADLIKGNSVVVTAQVADSDVALVDFFVNDVRKATVTGAPFNMALILPTEGALQLKAVAQDRAGNRGFPAFLDLNVAADTPPQIAITSPANGAAVGTGTAVTVTVQATDDLFAKEITLTASGELNAVQTRSSAAGKSFGTSFTLNIPAEITGAGTVQLNAVAKDSGGNLSTLAPLTLAVHDGTPPSLVSAASDGQTNLYKPGEGGSASFTFSDNMGITSVSCTAGGAATGSQSFAITPPQKLVTQSFAFDVAPGAASNAAITVSCTATDTASNPTVKSLNLAVADTVPPQVTITSPAEGASVGTGTTVIVSIQATDDLSVKEITLTTTGEVNSFQSKSNVSGTNYNASFTLPIPAEITEGGTLHLIATVKDSSGNASSQALRTLTVRDTMAPTGASLASPGQASYYKPGESGRATFTVSDNIGITGVSCTATGAATGNESFSIAPALKEVSQVFAFEVAGNASPYAAMAVTCSAFDAAGNQAVKTLNLTVADEMPPRVTGASIADNATDVPINAAITVNFSETLAVTTVTGASVVMTATASGQSVAGTVTLASDRRSLSFAPSAPFTTGASYQLNVSTGVTDDAGNPLDAEYLLTFTADHAAATVASVSPTAGSSNVPIGTAISVTFSEPVDPASVTAEKLVLSSSFGTVSGNITFSSDGKSVSLKPFGQLGYNRDYTITVKAGIRDVSGNATVADYPFTFRTQMADTDLVGYWAMDNDWSDSSGNGNHGTATNGPTFNADKVGGSAAANFDGVNDHLEVKNAASLNTPVITVEAWAKSATALWNKTGSLVSKRDAYILYPVENSKEIRFYVMAGGSWRSVSWNDQTLDLTQWHHYAGAYDGANLTIYVDGQAKGKVPYAGSVNVADTGSLFIGWDDSQAGKFYQGQIDEVAIYKRAMQPEDVVEHYNAGLTGDRTAPEPPTVDPVDAQTEKSSIILSGTKDADASIRINGTQVSGHDPATTWQVLYPLLPGANSFEITSRDLAGNPSEPIHVTTTVLPANQRDADILGAWHMDGNWYDYSGNGNHGTPNNGVTFSGSRADGSSSGSFDGVNDYVSMVDAPALHAGRNLTITGWLYVNSFSKEWQTVFWKGNTPDVTREYALWVNSAGYLHFNSTPQDKVSQISVNTAAGIVQTGRWQHFAALVSSDQNVMKVYLDGVERATGAYSQADITDTTGPLYLGNGLANNGSILNGLVDNVTMYKRALTVEEIQALSSAAPKLVLASPGQTMSYGPGEAGAATVTMTDDAGIRGMSCAASGAASGTLSVSYSSAQPAATEEMTFQVAANAAPYASIPITCTAYDADGNVGTVKLDLAVADTVLPTVVSTSIQNNAINVAATSPVTVTFSEAMAADSISLANIVLAKDDGSGQTATGSFTQSADKKSVTFTPVPALDGSTSYKLTVTTAVTDLAGNGLAGDHVVRFSTVPVTAAVIDSKGTSSAPFAIATGRYSSIQITNSYVVMTGPVAADSLTIGSNSTLTHSQTGTSGAERLDLSATTLTIDATSKIDVSRKGYLGGYSGGASVGATGRTVGNTTGGSTAGGGYGGLGGSGSITYGDYGNPTDMGSGGGGYRYSYGGSDTYYAGGNGGGYAKITAGTITLAGSIVADGGSVSSNYTGAGSGGGIRIDVGTLTGTGTISAKGGNSSGYSYAGGGGRIAVYYDTTSLPRANITAVGGTGMDASYTGGTGTVFLKVRSESTGTVYLDNKNTVTSYASTPLATVNDELVVTGKAQVQTTDGSILNGRTTITGAATVYAKRLTVGDGNELVVDGGNLVGDASEITADTVTVKNSGLITQLAATTTATHRLLLNVRTLSIDSSSKIDVNGKGYLGGYSGGASVGATGRTVGNTTGGSANGGGYGGLGVNGNPTYGDYADPNDMGSGGVGYRYSYGGNDTYYAGGNGGGHLEITAETINLFGNILADGGSVSSNYTGAGSGGGIRIDVGTLTGSGTISAKGGNGSGYSYAGGGGRIAVYYDTLGLPTANITSVGGTGMDASYTGGAGTLYLKVKSLSAGTLIVDNKSKITNYLSTPLPAVGKGIVGSLTSTSLTRSSGTWQTGILKGLKVKPDITRSSTFTIIDNTATTLIVDPVGGDLTQATSAGTTFTGVFVVDDQVVVTGKAWATSADPLLLKNETKITGAGILSADPITVDTGNELIIDGGSLYSDTSGITADTVTARNGGLITHWGATATTSHGLVMNVTSLSIDANSRIDVSGKGYIGGYPGGVNGDATGRTVGNLAGSTASNGGSYGGLGGGGNVNGMYGNELDPANLGSGGGGYRYSYGGNDTFYAGGSGGGYVKIMAGTITLTGSVLADGGNGSSYSGGGSGGGIRMNVGTLTGSGTISAKGGTSSSGSGGGGRIAIYYDALSFPSTKITSAGGTGGAYGMAGTVHLHQQ